MTSAKVVLICIDGWGLSDETTGNAIANAETPFMDAGKSAPGYARLDASGLAVGLPEGVMGNSEVGHLTIGGGQVQFQDLVRINLACKDGSIAAQPALVDAFARAKAGNGRLHYLGLVSDGGVHSHITHLFKLLSCAKEAGVPKSFVHAFTDGRDTPPTSGAGYIKQLTDYLAESGYGSLATVSGRYYGMDRDKRWERVKLAYDALLKGEGEASSDIHATIQSRYAAGENDEFLKPVITDSEGLVKDGDTLVFFDFRSDRMREIVETLGIKPPFETDVIRSDLSVVCFTEYKSDFGLPIVFPPRKFKNVLAEWLAAHKVPQFHTAETEKYAHVTFFFNGGQEVQFDLEERGLVPSPKVPTYDLKPEMNMEGVRDSVIDAIASGKYPFVMCNLASPDMVGHTGVYDKAVIACTMCDKVMADIDAACKTHGYKLFITSDHGNAEVMLTEDGKPVTSHTTNFVPFYCSDPSVKFTKSEGTLQDVAPTILKVMGLPIPSEMTGAPLV